VSLIEEPIRVLLVEDDLDCARLVSRRLRWSRAAAFVVDHAADLQSALARIERDEIDVLLLDLELPDSEAMSTIAVAANFARSVPIVMLTGSDDKVAAMVSNGCGVQDYLVKGCQDGAALARAVLGAIYRHRWVRRLHASPALAPSTLDATLAGRRWALPGEEGEPPAGAPGARSR
jgi:DNA-binding response OmpR family regulator